MVGEKRIKILYFGTYSTGEEYARNLALVNGLKKVGAELSECHTQLWSGFQDKFQAINQGLFFNLIALVKAYLRLLREYQRAEDFDFMFVGYIGQLDVFLARFLKIFHQKPIIFDAFYSLYDTMVKDRALYAQSSLMAGILKIIDRWSVKCSDLVLLDTREHIKYFCKEFGLKPEKFLAIPLGVDELNFYPRFQTSEVLTHNSQKGIFEVLNYSSYIPLHGIEVILQSADLLREQKDIRFTLVGKGQLYSKMRAKAEQMKLDNVRFIEWLPHKELVEKAVQADVLLGIFGTTEKASRVIPYKAYEALALAKPLITGDSPASRELLKDGEHCLLSPLGDGKALAERILLLKNNPELRQRIAEQGRRLFEEKCTWEKIGEMIIKELKERFLKN